MSSNEHQDRDSLSSRSRPQYHYFYGSTDDVADSIAEGNEQEQDSLIGEELLPTDHEEDTPTHIEHDFQHLLITNGDSSKAWFGGSRPQPQQENNSHGLGRAFLLVLITAFVSTLFASLLLPHTSQSVPSSQAFYIPFPEVNRADYGDPVEGFIDMDLFHPTLVSDSEARSFVFPFPTGAFWTNLVVPSPNEEESYPIVVYPYAYKWSDSTLKISYPSGHRVMSKQSIVDTFKPDLSISTIENIANRFVTKFDPLSVTLRFVATVSSKWETALVQGSPYATMQYLNATPAFEAPSMFKSVLCPGDDESFSDLLEDEDIEAQGEHRRLFGVCSLSNNTKKVTLRGVQFMFRTQEGISWIMFTSEPMNLEFDALSKTIIKSTAPFTGIIRIAYIPAKDSADEKTESSTGLSRLIYHAGIYPVGGQVSWEFQQSRASNGKSSPPLINSTSRSATIHFDYATRAMSDNSVRLNAINEALLMLALPHHAQLMSDNIKLDAKDFDLSYRCIKGTLTPVVGATWSYEEPLLDLEFDEPSQDIHPNARRTITNQIEDDITQLLPTATESIYGFAKQVARLAQLTHIANQLKSGSEAPESDDQESDVVERANSLLAGYLEMFFSGGVTDGLVFDTSMGGMVSSNGLSDPNEDFGNGRYNDHHFHYGYVLYACAVMGRIDPSFIERFGTHVDAIFHDIAHSTNGDSRVWSGSNMFFPLSRHKSWFDGHSFATGMFPFATGKSQESSSEAVNSYYGAYLWSLVRHGGSALPSESIDFTSLLLAMEIRSAKMYWHMIPSNSLSNNSVTQGVYPAQFQQNLMVGNVGMLDVTANTWFGSDPLYVHMINAIPITAATAVLFDENYVGYEYPYLMGSRTRSVEMAWRGYTVSIHSIINANSAWKEAQDLVSYELDAALSKSQVLYFISGRPSFNVSVSVSEPAPSQTNLTNDSALCLSHLNCHAANLTGLCCPTSDNQFLSCCD